MIRRNDISARQLSKEIGVDSKTMTKWIRDGKGPPCWITPGGRYRISREDADEWVRSLKSIKR